MTVLFSLLRRLGSYNNQKGVTCATERGIWLGCSEGGEGGGGGVLSKVGLAIKETRPAQPG